VLLLLLLLLPVLQFLLPQVLLIVGDGGMHMP
jgi:hypothetical protein